MSPQTIGRYKIEKELGRGGMAVVYLARDPLIKRQVAVKVLLPQLTLEPKLLARFQREAQVIAAIEHPFIVPIYDFGEHNGQPFIVMRYMDGGDLSARLKQGALSITEITSLIERIGAALDQAHKQGVIHRDLKPGNILFDQYNHPFLSDFGIARLLESNHTLTGTGGLIGTPAYMSPEQVHGDEEVDHRSDIYALGCIVFEALTGQTPYKAETPAELMMKHVLSPVPRILKVKSDLPPGSETIISQAMAKDREQRYSTAKSLAVDLAKVLQEFALSKPNEQTESDVPTPATTQPASRRLMGGKIYLIGGGLLLLIIGIGAVIFSGLNATTTDPTPIQEVAGEISGEGTVETTSDQGDDAGVAVSAQDTPTVTPQPTATPTPVPTSTSQPPTHTPVPTSTPTSTATATSQLPPHIEIVSVSATLDGEMLEATFQLKDVPPSLTFDRRGVRLDLLEYGWEVSIDLDNNPLTGNEGYLSDQEGSEYQLSALHFVFTPYVASTGPIEDNVEVHVSSSDGTSFDDSATIQVDSEANTITLIGIIPGISEESRLLFTTFDYLDGSDQMELTPISQLPPHIEIISVSATLDGEMLEATFQLRDVPPSLIFDRKGVPENWDEYEWGVNIDVDNNPLTGVQEVLTGDKGMDYLLSAVHFAFDPDAASTGSIEDNVQVEVWKYAEGGGTDGADPATIQVDSEANTITLSGIIPGISEESRLVFITKDYLGGSDQMELK